MKLPPWESRDDKDQRRMEAWVNEQLDARLEAASGDGSGGSALQFILRRSIDLAIRSKDRERLVELTRDEEARLYAFTKLLSKDTPGRKAKDREIVANASRHVDWVREIWREHYGRKNRARDNPPFAEDIVIRRFKALSLRVTRKDLTAFRNHQ